MSMAILVTPSLMSLWLWHHHSRTMLKEFPPEISLCLSPCWRYPASARGVRDRVHHGRVLPPAQPRSNFPPLCLPSLGSWSNLQSPTISLPLASAGCSSSLERSTSATLLRALQHCRLFVLFCPPHRLRSFGRGSAEGSLPLTPCPSSGLSWWDSWDVSQEWGLPWWTSRNFQRHAASACSQALGNPRPGAAPAPWREREARVVTRHEWRVLCHGWVLLLWIMLVLPSITPCNTAVRSLGVLLLYRTVRALGTVTAGLGSMSPAGVWSQPEALQWISHQLPCTLRGCVKLGTPLTHPDFGGVSIVVTVPLACTLKYELTWVPYFCRHQSGRTWRKMQLLPMAETNLSSPTAAVKKAHYLCSWLSCFYPRDHRALTTNL